MTFQTFKPQFAVARDVVDYKKTYLERAPRAVRNRFDHRIRIAALITPPQWVRSSGCCWATPKIEFDSLGSRSVTP